jgi:hypothetical protein
MYRIVTKFGCYGPFMAKDVAEQYLKDKGWFLKAGAYELNIDGRKLLAYIADIPEFRELSELPRK